MPIYGSVTEKSRLGFLPSLVYTPVGHGVDRTIVHPFKLRRRLQLPVGFRQGAAGVRGSVVGPPPRLIPECMSELYSYMSQPGDPQVKGWYAACYLLSVHPWPDGNGRTGRYFYRKYTGSSETKEALRTKFNAAFDYLINPTT